MKVVLLVILVLLITGCSSAQVESPADQISTRDFPEYWPTGDWRTSTPEEQGMDSEMLADMLELIDERNYSIDSVSIIRNGYMVADVTFFPFPPDSKHIIHSKGNFFRFFTIVG